MAVMLIIDTKCLVSGSAGQVTVAGADREV